MQHRTPAQVSEKPCLIFFILSKNIPHVNLHGEASSKKTILRSLRGTVFPIHRRRNSAGQDLRLPFEKVKSPGTAKSAPARGRSAGFRRSAADGAQIVWFIWWSGGAGR